MIYLVGLLAGFCVIGPLLAWLTGMFNPIGFLGVPPWRVPESARAAEREGRIWTPIDTPNEALREKLAALDARRTHLEKGR